MSQPLLWLLVGVFLAAQGVAQAAGLAPGDAARPNIVVILADDLGYGDVGCYGQTKYKTPHLDRMAREGARLTQFNAPASFCAPTRASLLTGRYPFRCGMTQNPAPDGGPIADRVALPREEVTLAQVLAAAGYRTGMIGKWHLGHSAPDQWPTQRGFHSYFGIPYSNDMRPVTLYRDTAAVEYPVVQATLTKRYTDEALRFLENAQDQPFFLYFAHAMPHKPLAASEDFYKKSGAGLYGDVMSELDASVGRVLAKLEQLNLESNTLVIFTSDNGAWFGGSCGGLRGMKGSSYEGGYRVPCIARWPGRIPAGHTSDQLAVMMDLFATVLHVAGVAPPADRVIDGRNLMPLLTGDAPSPHEVILGAQGARLATVRNQRWKLHVLPPSDNFQKLHKPDERWVDPRGPDGVTILAPYEQAQPGEHPGLTTGDPPRALQLFDLLADPGEQTDVAAAHPEIVRQLKLAFDRHNPPTSGSATKPGERQGP